MFGKKGNLKLIAKLSPEDYAEFNKMNAQYNSGATLFLSIICVILLSFSMTVGYFSDRAGAEGVEEFWVILPYHVTCIALSFVVFIVTLIVRKKGMIHSTASDLLARTQMCLVIAICLISSHVETPIIGIKNISGIIIFMFALGVFMRFSITITLILEALIAAAGVVSTVITKDVISNFYPSVVNILCSFVLASFAAFIYWESRKRSFIATKELERLASLDTLTRLRNRNSFEVYITHEWQRAAKEWVGMSLLMIDVDYFGKHNELHGEHKSDKCLYTVADIISDSVRKSDFVARYGGDEFAVSMTDAGVEMAERAAEEIINNIRKENMLHGDSVAPYVTLSIGCMVCSPGNPDGITVEEFIKMADEALHTAKEQGGNQIVFHPKSAKDKREVSYGVWS